MHFLGSNLLKIESAETNPKSVYSMASVLVRPPFQICEKISLFQYYSILLLICNIYVAKIQQIIQISQLLTGGIDL